VQQAAEVMLDAVCTTLRSAPPHSVQRVVFILFTPAALAAFEQALAAVSM
jgi:hypothetical protein